MECLDIQGMKIVNAQPNNRYLPLTLPREAVQERIKDLTDLGKHNNCHYGETIHVVGCGPSARNFADLAAGRISIGVNGAGVVIPEIKYWLACDPIDNDRPLNKAIRNYLENNTYVEHKFQFVLSWKQNPMVRFFNDWTVFRQTGEILFRADRPHWRNGLYFYHSSVHASLELARLMGAKKIVLWGVDYTDRSHCYTDKEIVGDCKDNPGKPWSDYAMHLDGFKKIKAIYDKENIEIINANPDSLLDVFKKETYGIKPKIVVPELIPEQVSEAPEVPPEFLPVDIAEAPEARCEDESRPWYITWRMFCTKEYQDMAKAASWEFARYDIGVKWELMESQNNWMKNCLQRPALLLKVADNHPNLAVGLLDSDVMPLKDPKLFKENNCKWDIMARFRGNSKPIWDRYCAGYVAFAATPKGRETLVEWVRICEEDPEPDLFCREQGYLCMAIEKVKPRILELPTQYDFVPPKKWDKKIPDGTVLLHEPASRKLLKQIGGCRGTRK